MEEINPCQALQEALEAAHDHGAAEQRLLDAQAAFMETQMEAQRTAQIVHSLIHPQEPRKDLN